MCGENMGLTDRLVAKVYIAPGPGQPEWPEPVLFYRPYTKKCLAEYARACRSRGQLPRIVWNRTKKKAKARV